MKELMKHHYIREGNNKLITKRMSSDKKIKKEADEEHKRKTDKAEGDIK